ncbi:MAG TPA: Dabb family protein [Pseudonocardia sp.]
MSRPVPAPGHAAPIQHVVVFRWQPTATPDVGRLARALTDFVATLDGVLTYGCGPDIGLRDTNDDFAVVATFADEQALTAYLDHPQHKQITAEQVTPHLAEKHISQFRPSLH